VLYVHSIVVAIFYTGINFICIYGWVMGGTISLLVDATQIIRKVDITKFKKFHVIAGLKNYVVHEYFASKYQYY
jgi:hypothetical protein